MNIYFIISIIPWFLFTILKNKKTLHMLQQNLYNVDSRYLKWVFNNKKKIILDTDYTIFIPILAFGMLFNDMFKLLMTLYFITYIIYFVIHNLKLKQEQSKKPLVITARVKRLIITLLIIYLLPLTILLTSYKNSDIELYYLVISLSTYLAYILVYIANIINKPVEKLVYFYYLTKAKNKLRSINPKVIGITGSYGKTSSKNILGDILNVKYNALPSPRNLNTPYGLMTTINSHLDKFDDILIAEMGAYKKGEIKELCDLVKPKYGILTKIGTAHLESFGSEENIQSGKFELIESLPKDGIGILNKDDDKQVSYKLKNKCKILWIGIDNKDVDVYATNIKPSYKGTIFDVIFKNDKNKYSFETKLLGNANVYNILASLALGIELGISVEELQRAVKNVKPVEHRLELKKYGNVNIIDDAYNSNPVGSKMALDVLSLMPGKKIIVTPGMIELGLKQNELNKKFGEYIADVCDEVILVGEKQTKPIYEGLKSKKYDDKHIHIINDVKIAFKLIEELKDKETYALLENDLPDTFNE
jgi:UDP-N-acetylmuramoyl-tripeptide--D-alanyl-D-alanine ligase